MGRGSIAYICQRLKIRGFEQRVSLKAKKVPRTLGSRSALHWLSRVPYLAMFGKPRPLSPTDRSKPDHSRSTPRPTRQTLRLCGSVNPRPDASSAFDR